MFDFKDKIVVYLKKKYVFKFETKMKKTNSYIFSHRRCFFLHKPIKKRHISNHSLMVLYNVKQKSDKASYSKMVFNKEIIFTTKLCKLLLVFVPNLVLGEYQSKYCD